MKKTFIYKLILCLIVSLCCTSIVEAADDDSSFINNSDRHLLLCEYKDMDGTVRNRIYYSLQNPNRTDNVGPWSYFYRRYNSLVYLTDAWTNANLSFGLFSNVMTSSRVSYQTSGNRMPKSFEKNFVCPQYAFADYDWYNEVCYGDYATCGKKFDNGPYPLNQDAESIFKIIDDYAAEYISNEENISVLKNRQNINITDIIRTRVREYIINKYSLGTTYTMPPFVDNYLKELKFDEYDSKISENYEKLKDQVEEEVAAEVAAGTLTEEEANAILEYVENLEIRDILDIKLAGIKDLNISDDPNCNGILGPDMTEVVNNIFRFVQYLGPILVIVLSSVDFLKAAVSGDDGQLKKSSSRLMKRIICAILLFFVPLICNVILDIGGVTIPDTCIAQYGTTDE